MRTRNDAGGFAVGKEIGGVDDGAAEAASATCGTIGSAAFTCTSVEFPLFDLSTAGELSAGLRVGPATIESAESSGFRGAVDGAGLEILFFGGATGTDGAAAAGAVADDGV
jgi:hypothetical protein